MLILPLEARCSSQYIQLHHKIHKCLFYIHLEREEDLDLEALFYKRRKKEKREESKGRKEGREGGREGRREGGGKKGGKEGRREKRREGRKEGQREGRKEGNHITLISDLLNLSSETTLISLSDPRTDLPIQCSSLLPLKALTSME